jgi:uncharacterized protein
MTFGRPAGLFDRASEWDDLARFVASASRLGVVWGPRRAGKSTLLASLADEVGGLYYEAVRQDPALSRAELGRLIGHRLGVAALRFEHWDEAIETLLALPECPVVVLDEFGYLCEASPELPSSLQRAVDSTRSISGRASRAGHAGRADRMGRLIVCGSAISQLSHLLDRDQPLFGRAQLAMVVDAFDFRSAAGYWGVVDRPGLAFPLHATLGGLPGYRDVVVDGPISSARFDRWIESRVLSAASPLLEEDGLVLQASGLDANVYRSILTAVARGDRTPTGIGSRTGRSASSLARPVESLVGAGMLHRVVDPLRSRRSRYELADPFLVFHDAIIRPHRTRLRRRQEPAVWAESAETWRSQVLGPHFERLCREATRWHHTDFGLDGVETVGASLVADPASRTNLEIDVMATGPGGHIVAIGEAKHTHARRGVADLARLDRIKDLLPADRSEGCRLLIFAAHGADRELTRVAASRPDVELVDLARLYGRARTPVPSAET